MVSRATLTAQPVKAVHMASRRARMRQSRDQMKLGIAMARRSVTHPALKLTPGASGNAALIIANTLLLLFLVFWTPVPLN